MPRSGPRRGHMPARRPRRLRVPPARAPRPVQPHRDHRCLAPSETVRRTLVNTGYPEDTIDVLRRHARRRPSGTRSAATGAVGASRGPAARCRSASSARSIRSRACTSSSHAAQLADADVRIHDPRRGAGRSSPRARRHRRARGRRDPRRVHPRRLLGPSRRSTRRVAVDRGGRTGASWWPRVPRRPRAGARPATSAGSPSRSRDGVEGLLFDGRSAATSTRHRAPGHRARPARAHPGRHRAARRVRGPRRRARGLLPRRAARRGAPATAPAARCAGSATTTSTPASRSSTARCPPASRPTAASPPARRAHRHERRRAAAARRARRGPPPVAARLRARRRGPARGHPALGVRRDPARLGRADRAQRRRALGPERVRPPACTSTPASPPIGSTSSPTASTSTASRPTARARDLDAPRRLRLLFVGGLIRRKGPDVLLEAYREAFAGRDDVTLVIKDFGAAGIYARHRPRRAARVRGRGHAPARRAPRGRAVGRGDGRAVPRLRRPRAPVPRRGLRHAGARGDGLRPAGGRHRRRPDGRVLPAGRRVAHPRASAGRCRTAASTSGSAPPCRGCSSPTRATSPS